MRPASGPVLHALSAIVIAASGALASATPARAEQLLGQASVIDGDTIEIHGRRIRLSGIDAVESGQRCRRDGKPWLCGKDSAFALADRIGRSTIGCQGTENDRYGRLVAVCFQAGEDLNRWMVEQGWAVAYRRYSMDYVAAEDAARRAGRGLWSGQFEMPWAWRRKTR
jgi:endonuclease YncB( thermonuclease family)